MAIAALGLSCYTRAVVLKMQEIQKTVCAMQIVKPVADETTHNVETIPFVHFNENRPIWHAIFHWGRVAVDSDARLFWYIRAEKCPNPTCSDNGGVVAERILQPNLRQPTTSCENTGVFWLGAARARVTR